MPSLKTIAVSTTAAFATLALVACGSQATPGSDSAKPNVLAQLASDALGSIQKTIDTTNKASSVAVTMTGNVAGESVDMRGVIDLGDPLKADMTVNDPKEGQTTVRIIDTTFYIGVPEEEQASMDGKKWLKMNLADLGQNSDAMARQFEDMDPVKGLKTLLKGKDVTVVGEENVDGVQTVHYTTTSPVDSYLTELDAEVRKGVQAQLAKAGVTEIKTDVWVDEQYQPRRVHMVMGTVSDFTINYTDYGKPVTIEAPPAAETLDFKEMLDQLKGMTGN